jgi:16S rRNA (guanine527-N7)-methyltransferase
MTETPSTEQGVHRQEPSASLPAAPAAAAAIFGDRLALAERFATTLADTGVSHGLIGPREVSRLWDRHVLNCAVAHGAFPEAAHVIDVGSGAGLPGLALAMVRPDLHIHLVEPMLRRTTWLSATIDSLGLDNCTVHRGRAEEFHGRLRAPFATARAVARIDKLARWTFPLLEENGVLVALKGEQAAQELEEERDTLTRLGMVEAAIRTYGADLLKVPTVTMELTVRGVGDAAKSGRRAPRKRSSSRSARSGTRGGNDASRGRADT